jgi:hypothetical protein
MRSEFVGRGLRNPATRAKARLILNRLRHD